MSDTGRDPWLLTPGPLTTSPTVKESMLHDWGSRDHNFININRSVRDRLVALAGGDGTHVCVPLQGSGTFAVEATVGTLVPPQGKALILVNGAYGKRVATICDYYRRAYETLETPEDVPAGEMPRHMILHVERTMVQRITPGTRVKVMGVYALSKGMGKASGSKRGRDESSTISTTVWTICSSSCGETGRSLVGASRRHRRSGVG